MKMRSIVSLLTAIRELFSIYAALSLALGRIPEAIIGISVMLVIAYFQEFFKPYWKSKIELMDDQSGT